MVFYGMMILILVPSMILTLNEFIKKADDYLLFAKAF